MRAGENVVIDGTLGWELAGRQLLAERAGRGCREVSILDAEVRREVARAQAVARRWWAGRCDRMSELGGWWAPPAVIDRLYPYPGGGRSVCAVNARALFDSATARTLPVVTVTVTVMDSAGLEPTTRTHRRRRGALQVDPPGYGR